MVRTWRLVALAGFWSWTACSFPQYDVDASPSGGGGPSEAGSTASGTGGTGGTSNAGTSTVGGGTAGTSVGGEGGAGPEPACDNGILDGDETDIDCGGTCPLACSIPTCSELAKSTVDANTVVAHEALVGWYRFFDGQDMGLDASATGSHALSVTKVKQQRDPQRGCVAGFLGDGRLELPILVQENMTLALWLKTDVAGSGKAGDAWHVGAGLLDAEKPAAVDDFGLCLLGEQAAFGIGNPDTTLASTVTVVDAVWHHVAATRDDATGEMVLYIDGTENGRATGPIGKRSAATQIFTGRGRLVADVADIRLYTRVLSAQEVGAVFQGQ